ncbi:MAG: restriction endonuclease subunit M [Candidatus Riflebacteria bacterium HGW-Riflebacteria-2]|jgi:type I restriction-modification system DNA methylase subunit|nr:MAG: restriction endonuclease subunit M [Candidatus Riflebacteria bacterium HGW-Riflebacteria-2]
MQLINTRQAAGLLEVSETTVRNWVKHGYVAPVAGNASRFSTDDVKKLKQRIAAGELKRLCRRANKTKTSSSFIPEEYLDNQSFSAELATIRAIFLENSVDIDNALFALTLKQLVLRGEAAIAGDSLFVAASCRNIQRKTLANELTSWLSELPPRTTAAQKVCKRLFNALTDASHADTIGTVYQSLKLAGSKATQGSFYTPAAIIDDIFKDHGGRQGYFIDPCCGTGQFLLCAARNGFRDPNRLFGSDIDRLAVRIARINLLLAFPGSDFSPQIYHADALLQNANLVPFGKSSLNSQFTLIASNPPWGASFADSDLIQLHQRYPAIRSRESFSFFLARSLELAAPGAVISFILPESFLNIRLHSDIRHHLLANAQVLTIHLLGRPFKNVFTPVIRLDLRKEKPDTDWSISLKKRGCPDKTVVQARFAASSDSIFETSTSDNEFRVIDKLYSLPHLTLRDNADWALGIVTGDNNRHLSAVAEPGMEPIYRGRDVLPFRLQPATSFIRCNPVVFQQIAPVAKYRAPEKLIYRFIANRLIFAYDDRQTLTLNSANILIPRLAGYPAKAVLCLLNSKLLQFIFARKFNTHKVLRGDLEQLPIPVFTEKILHELVALADCAIRGQPVAEAIDAVIFESLNFSKTEIDLILSGIALE